MGFPFIAVFAAALALLGRLFGYRPQKDELQITTVIAIAIGTQVFLSFQKRLQRPSKLLLILSGVCWTLLAVLALTGVLRD